MAETLSTAPTSASSALELIGDFNSGVLTGPQSFSFNGFGFDPVSPGPYGMAERLDITLQPGATVFVQGVSMDASAVPEPQTWALMATGFGLMGLMAYKRRKTGNRLATFA